MTYREIGAQVGITKDTVGKWLKDEYANRAEHREQDKEAAIEVYREIQRAAWDRYDTTEDRSLNTSGLLNVIRSAQERIDKITGAEAPFKHQEVDEEYDVVWDDADDLAATE